MTPSDRLTVLAEPIPIPAHVDLSEGRDWLFWDRFADGPPEPRRLDSSALERFLRLRTPAADPDDVLDFARHDGVLAICPHGFPTSHASYTSVSPGSPVFPEHTKCLPGRAYEEPYFTNSRRRGEAEGRWAGEGGVLTGAEPIEYWRSTASAFRAALQIARQLRADQLGRREDWRAVYEWPPGQARVIRFGAWSAPQPPPADPLPRPGSWSPVLYTQRAGENRGAVSPEGRAFRSGGAWLGAAMGEPGGTAEEQRDLLAAFVEQWLSIGAVRPVFRWGDAGPRLSFSAGGLFGALAVHVAIMVMQGQGWAMCSGCGAPYAPRRLEGYGRRTYCGDCREHGLPARDAARDYRARKAEGRRASTGIMGL